jgi:cell wall-associated NlpC family hydrolase
MLRDGARLIGVPYVWGAISGLGIDCSGLVQLLHRLVGVEIPRDADMQFDAGQPVEPPFQPGDLLFFTGSSKRRAITHVGMSVGGWQMLHSSINRNGVFEENVQAGSLAERFAGARSFLPD